MKWCTLNWDKKGLFVYWSYMYGSIYDENYDNGEEYHLDIPFDWWAKSWEEAKEDFESVYHPIVLPWFMAYLFLGIPTIIHIVKRKKYIKQYKSEDYDLDYSEILND